MYRHTLPGAHSCSLPPLHRGSRRIVTVKAFPSGYHVPAPTMHHCNLTTTMAGTRRVESNPLMQIPNLLITCMSIYGGWIVPLTHHVLNRSPNTPRPNEYGQITGQVRAIIIGRKRYWRCGIMGIIGGHLWSTEGYVDLYLAEWRPDYGGLYLHEAGYCRAVVKRLLTIYANIEVWPLSYGYLCISSYGNPFHGLNEYFWLAAISFWSYRDTELRHFKNCVTLNYTLQASVQQTCLPQFILSYW